VGEGEGFLLEVPHLKENSSIIKKQKIYKNKKRWVKGKSIQNESIIWTL